MRNGLGFEVRVHNGTSNLLEKVAQFSDLSEAIYYTQSVPEWQSATVLAWDNRNGNWHPLMKRLHTHSTPDGYSVPSRAATLVPLFGRVNG